MTSHSNKIFKLLFDAPNLGGDKIIRLLHLKNKHFFIFLPLFALSWWIYSEFFMNWFDFTWRFVPTFTLGFLVCIFTFKLLKMSQNKEVV